jgi:hypothetical protein
MTPWLADTHGIALITGRKPATIRKWASRGLLTRHATGAHGRALYSVQEAEQLAGALHWHTPSTLCHTEHVSASLP